MNVTVPPTADLFDAHSRDCESCSVQFRQFGRRRAFAGAIRTVVCRDDNALVRRALETPSPGEVLVVDGGGSLESALLGDVMAELGRKNGWAGAIIYGAVRDSLVLADLDFGVKAIGTNPKKSGKAGTGASDITVTIGGVDFIPGHWVYTDDDGLLIFPRKIA